MSDFNAALEHLLDLEGYPGYVNDPQDHGGETFAGIARKYWRGWPGWQLIDSLKESSEAKKRMTESKQLRQMVAVFYKQNFWTPPMERMTNQALAEWLFQMSVNCGYRQAVKFAQRALGVNDDGVWGHGTETALSAANQSEILGRCREEARKFYQALAAKDDTQKRFLNGWINRANA